MSRRDPSERKSFAAVTGAAGVVWAIVGALLLTALLFLLLAGNGASADWSGRVQEVEAPPTLSGSSAEKVAQRISAAHADVTAIWQHDLRWRFGRSYTPPEIVHFTGSRPSACGGGASISGLAYCPVDRTLSVDLGLLEELSARLSKEWDRALVLLVAHGTAAHLQAELSISGDADRTRAGLDGGARAALDRDLALQGDCLTGVWAQRASKHIGPVEEGDWTNLVQTVRDASPAGARAARLDLGELDEREDAFARGYADGELRDCLLPGLSGVLG